jgi:molecular chaperone DnaK (HSP70)
MSCGNPAGELPFAAKLAQMLFCRTGIFAPIIERNTVVPTSRFKTFSTIDPGTADSRAGNQTL